MHIYVLCGSVKHFLECFDEETGEPVLSPYAILARIYPDTEQGMKIAKIAAKNLKERLPEQFKSNSLTIASTF